MKTQWIFPLFLLFILPGRAIEVASPGPGWEEANRTANLVIFAHTHPGGDIRDWIANKSNTTSIPDLFRAVADRAAR